MHCMEISSTRLAIGDALMVGFVVQMWPWHAFYWNYFCSLDYLCEDPDTSSRPLIGAPSNAFKVSTKCQVFAFQTCSLEYSWNNADHCYCSRNLNQGVCYSQSWWAPNCVQTQLWLGKKSQLLQLCLDTPSFILCEDKSLFVQTALLKLW